MGRGPLPEAMGRFNAVRLERDSVALDYTADGVEVRERIRVHQTGAPTVVRFFRVGAST